MRGLTVGRLFGIPIKLNWTFLLVLPLFAVLIGTDIGQLSTVLGDVLGSELETARLEADYWPWILGSMAAIGLFVGVLLHELGHSLVAMQYGYEIESITLWLLGGLADFAEFPEDWQHEFWIAIAGPIVSVAVGIVCFGAFLGTPAEFDRVRFVVGYLALLNVVLAIFNMLPAFPMDGGRILRALLARGRPHAQATQLAAEIGKGFAFLIGILGLFGNLFLVLLAFFIYIAASSEAQQTVLKAAFEDVTVGDVMTREEDLHVVSRDATVAELMEQMFRERHTGYPVVDGGALVGMVTLDDAREVQQVERDAYRVEEVMSSEVKTIDPDTNAMEALQRIREHSVGRLPVVENGELVGLVSRTDIMTAFDIIRSSDSYGSFTEQALGNGPGESWGR